MRTIPESWDYGPNNGHPDDPRNWEDADEETEETTDEVEEDNFSDTRPGVRGYMPRQQRPLGGAFWFVVTVVLVASIAAGVFA